MKGERLRYQQTGEFHFLTFSCFRRRTYLSSGAAMELFEDALERVRLRSLFAVAGYVVMPEHVHLLVNEPGRGLLSRTVLNLIKFGMRKGPPAKYKGPRLSICGLCLLGIRGDGCRLRN
jgi:putative transposase